MKYLIIKKKNIGLPETFKTKDGSFVYQHNSFINDTDIDFDLKEINNLPESEVKTIFIHKVFKIHPKNITVTKKEFILKPYGEREDWFLLYVLTELRKIKTNNKEDYIALSEKFYKTIKQFDKAALLDKEQYLNEEDTKELINKAISIVMEEREYLSERQIITQSLSVEKVSAKTMFETLEEYFTKAYSNYVLYIQGEASSIYEYKDNHYKYVSKDTVKAEIGRYIKQQNLYQYNSTAKYNDIYERVKLYLRTQYQRYFYEEDINKKYINLQNGLFDISKRELITHDPKYFTVNQLPFAYEPEQIDTPLFTQHIDLVTQGDKEIQRMLQQMFGYVIGIGNPRHKAHILYGATARNGKTVTTKLLSKLLGKDNVSNISLEGLSGKRQFELAGIENKILNISDEATAKYIEAPILTSMIGEGTIEIRKLYTPAYDYQVTANFVINANDLPRFSDGTGMSNRVVIIPFNYQIPEEDRIPHFEDKIAEKELSGIFNWALQGLEDVEKNGFIISGESQKEKQEYDRDNNPVLAFLEEKCEIKEGAWTSNDDLYGSRDFQHRTGYNLYCEEYGVKALSSRMFGKEFRRIRETKMPWLDIPPSTIKYNDGKSKRGYPNIQFKPEFDEDDDFNFKNNEDKKPF